MVTITGWEVDLRSTMGRDRAGRTGLAEEPV